LLEGQFFYSNSNSLSVAITAYKNNNKQTYINM